MDEEFRINEESKPMTDEEIRAAAENIGTSPYSAYESRNDDYSAYSNYDYSGSTDLNERIPEKKKKHFFAKAAKFAGLAAVFGVIAGATFFGATTGLKYLFGDNSLIDVAGTTIDQQTTNALQKLGVSNLVIAPTKTTQDSNDTSNAVVDVVKNNMRSTVCVSVSKTLTERDFWTGRTQSYETEGGGSGFIVGESDTEIFIATNNHVVEGVDTITITFSDDEKVAATTRATDPDNDLAIVSVLKADVSADTLSEIKIATLGNSDETEVGEMVIAIGNALGYGQSVTVGYLSAKDRKVTYENTERTLLQTDAAINEGNSGGPLFNVKGEVIGINCAKYSSESVEGMCFAIPITAAIPILDDLIHREIVPEEEQGYLGVTIQAVTEDLAKMFGFPYGVRIQSVVEDSAAAKAGLYRGDIITAVNDVAVSDEKQLISKVNSYRAGTTVNVKIQRLVEGKWTEMELEVTLMNRPEE